MTIQNTGKVFIYWDNSNIYISAQHVAQEIENLQDTRRLRIQFQNLYELARAGREVASAFAAGSIPPELKILWNRLENVGVEVTLLQRGEFSHGEQGVDEAIQRRMLEDALDNNGQPGIVVLITGDGGGYDTGTGFHRNLERLHKKGWKIELLSWRISCKKAMREWVESVGSFIALDDFYESVTFLEGSLPGQPIADPRYSVPIDQAKRFESR